MIIEFELQGSKMLHKGVFETTGFWVKFEEEGEFVVNECGEASWWVSGYKIYSHFSFSYFHVDKPGAEIVYNKLISVLRGAQGCEIEGVGYIRKLNK